MHCVRYHFSARSVFVSLSGTVRPGKALSPKLHHCLYGYIFDITVAAVQEERGPRKSSPRSNKSNSYNSSSSGHHHGRPKSQGNDRNSFIRPWLTEEKRAEGRSQGAATGEQPQTMRRRKIEMLEGAADWSKTLSEHHKTSNGKAKVQ